MHRCRGNVTRLDNKISENEKEKKRDDDFAQDIDNLRADAFLRLVGDKSRCGLFNRPTCAGMFFFFVNSNFRVLSKSSVERNLGWGTRTKTVHVTGTIIEYRRYP